ncbi:MAG: hypothetical protein GY749_02900 [Desulfobacteraceae bacterium]|nr:hypothetical protein [Desulfobacteraceae bacterium]
MMQRYGADRIHRIMLTEKFYSENFPVYKAILTGREMEIPEHSDIVDDHRAVKKIKGVPRITDDQKNKKTGRTKARRHGDSAIAGLMLTYAVNNIDGEHGTVDYESVVKRRIFGEGTY